MADVEILIHSSVYGCSSHTSKEQALVSVLDLTNHGLVSLSLNFFAMREWFIWDNIKKYLQEGNITYFEQ